MGVEATGALMGIKTGRHSSGGIGGSLSQVVDLHIIVVQSQFPQEIYYPSILIV